MFSFFRQKFFSGSPKNASTQENENSLTLNKEKTTNFESVQSDEKKTEVKTVEKNQFIKQKTGVMNKNTSNTL